MAGLRVISIVVLALIPIARLAGFSVALGVVGLGLLVHLLRKRAQSKEEGAERANTGWDVEHIFGDGFRRSAGASDLLDKIDEEIARTERFSEEISSVVTDITSLPGMRPGKLPSTHGSDHDDSTGDEPVE